MIDLQAPTMVDDHEWCRWWLRCQRLALSPEMITTVVRTFIDTNIHHVLPTIQAPTLVLHRRGNRQIRVEHGRYLGEHIPGAVYRELQVAAGRALRNSREV